jgi:alpha-D-xyloside xylohydrolase
MLRGVMMDAPADKKTESINDQFMCGNSLLINPVCEFKQRSRNVYLPAGINWYDFYSNTFYKGGQTINAIAPISTIPVFVKEGSIIVTGPVMQYSTEKPADNLTITIYGNKNAAYTLYEDENDNCNYEKGKSAVIKINYSAAAQTVTLQKQTGSFTGMLNSRRFTIVRINNNGTKISTAVTYNGNKQTITLK